MTNRQPAEAPAPVAWAIFAENGNVRKWGSKPFEGAEPIYRALLPETAPPGWIEAMARAMLPMVWDNKDVAAKREICERVRDAYAALRTAMQGYGRAE